MKPDEFFDVSNVVLPETRCNFLDNKNCSTCGKFLGVYYRYNVEKYYIRLDIQKNHNKLRQQQFDSLELIPLSFK